MPPTATSTPAEQALAAMRASVFGTDPMAPPPPMEPQISAPSTPSAPVHHSPSRDPGELGDFIEAAGLLRYDPAAITRIYAGHPRRLLRRLQQRPTLVHRGRDPQAVGAIAGAGLVQRQLHRVAHIGVAQVGGAVGRAVPGRRRAL